MSIDPRLKHTEIARRAFQRAVSAAHRAARIELGLHPATACRPGASYSETFDLKALSRAHKFLAELLEREAIV